MAESKRALRPLFDWPFARIGAERLATAKSEAEVAEYLADALGEVMGRPRMLVAEVVEHFGISFARERYATTVAVEAGGGMLRADGRRYTACAVFLRLCREWLGGRWEEIFRPPNEKSLRDAARTVLERVVPKWRMPPAPESPAKQAPALPILRQQHDTQGVPRLVSVNRAGARPKRRRLPNGVDVTDPQAILDGAVDQPTERGRTRRRHRP